MGAFYQNVTIEALVQMYDLWHANKPLGCLWITHRTTGHCVTVGSLTNFLPHIAS